MLSKKAMASQLFSRKFSEIFQMNLLAELTFAWRQIQEGIKSLRKMKSHKCSRQIHIQSRFTR